MNCSEGERMRFDICGTKSVIGWLAMATLVIVSTFAPGSASAQDGSGIIPTKEGAVRFLQEALVRPDIASLVWVRGGYPNAKRSDCKRELRPGFIDEQCIVNRTIEAVGTRQDCETGKWACSSASPGTAKDCEIGLYGTVTYASYRATDPKSLNQVGQKGTAWFDMRTSKIYLDGNKIYLMDLRNKEDQPFYLLMKDNSVPRIFQALNFIKSNCDLESQTGF